MARRPARPHQQRVPRIPKARRMAVRREDLDRLVDQLNNRREVINELVREHTFNSSASRKSKQNSTCSSRHSPS